jgi:hypothetical protein
LCFSLLFNNNWVFLLFGLGVCVFVCLCVAGGGGLNKLVPMKQT